MNQKMQTLNEKYEELLKKNEELSRLLTSAENRAFIAEDRYNKIIKKSYSIYADGSQINRIITIKMDLDMLNSAKAFDDMLEYLVRDAVRKARMIK